MDDRFHRVPIDLARVETCLQEGLFGNALSLLRRVAPYACDTSHHALLIDVQPQHDAQALLIRQVCGKVQQDWLAG